MERTTPYFRNEILRKRPYLEIEICRAIIRNPIKKEIQPDGRIRFWGKIVIMENKYLRVVTLEDGITIHNAFLDRGFKP
ncbi:MAG: hypothetical protein AB1306_07480 [Nitrospirota bacterium]